MRGQGSLSGPDMISPDMGAGAPPVREVPLHTYTRWALTITVASAPLYVLRWHIGPLPTTLLENLIWITFALYAVDVWRRAVPPPSATPYDIPIAVLLFAGVIGVFVAPDHRGALGIFRAYLVEPIVLYYIANASLRTTRHIQVLLGGWAIGALLFSFIEVVTFLHALINGGLLPGHAAAAFDINPNQVALYLEPLIGLAAGFAAFGVGWPRWLAAGTVAVLLGAELATLSRGGLLTLLALAFALILTAPGVRVRLALLAATLLGVVTIPELPIIGPRVLHAVDPIAGTVYGRQRLWIATLRMLHDHPIFGAGLNAYQTVMAPYRLADSNLLPEQYPHSILLTEWSELGLLGLAAFAYILVNLMVRPWRAFSKALGFNRPLVWGLGAAFLMIAVHGIVDVPFWKNDLSVEFWALAALQVIAIRQPAA